MKFVIDRSKWRSGGDMRHAIGVGDTLMLNPEGFMCCLGQVCQQLGAPKRNMNAGEPDAVFDNSGRIVAKRMIDAGLVLDSGANTDLSRHAMEINDREEFTTKEREAELKKLFRKHGHQISFVGKPVKNYG